MVRLQAIWFIAIAAMGLCLGCSCRKKNTTTPSGVVSPQAPAEQTSVDSLDNTADRPIKLFALTDLRGYMEPCGCTSNPLGGLARLSTVLQEERKTAGDSLFVDTGDRYFDWPPRSDRLLQQGLISAKTIDQILDKLGLTFGTFG